MSTISTALRNFKEPTKEQLTQNFFSLPATPTPSSAPTSPSTSNAKDGPEDEEIEKMDINAVLSLGIQGEEDSYVSVQILSQQPLIESSRWMNILVGRKVIPDVPLPCFFVFG